MQRIAFLLGFMAAMAAGAVRAEICISVPLTWTVNTTADTVADDGLTSLREAVAAALANDQCLGPDQVQFDLPADSVITLGSTLVVADDELKIDGGGLVTLRISAADAPLIALSRTTATTALELANLSLDGQGITRTRAALEAGTGTALVLRVVSAYEFDGGDDAPGVLLAEDVSEIDIYQSLFAYNRGQSPARSGGGAISVQIGDDAREIAIDYRVIDILNSSFFYNESPGNGGAVRISLRPNVTLQVDRSTFVANEAGGNGGALAHDGGTLSVTASTLSLNAATGDGGALYTQGPDLWLAHSTVVGNAAQAGGGVAGSGATLQGTHVILSLNTASSGGAQVDGLTDALTFSLVDVAADALRLGPLAYNGGFTLTHLLLPGSVAIDAGNADDIVLPVIDQRGQPRVQGAGLDIGAVEVVPESDEAGSKGGGGGAPGILWLAMLGLLALRRRLLMGDTRR